MPRYLQPSQNLSYDIPAEGEIFRNPNDPRQGEIYKRQGGQIKVLKETQFRKPDNAAVRLGDVLSQQGINYGGIREVSPEALDILQNKLGHTFTQGTLEDFRTSSPQNREESYTQGISPTNPNQATLTSNTGVVSRFTPSPITTTGEISGQGKIEPYGQMNLNDRNAQIQALQGGINSTSDRLRQLSQQRGVGFVPQFQQQFPSAMSQTTTSPYPQTTTPPPVDTGVPTQTTSTPSLQDKFFEQLIENMKPSQGATETQKKLDDIIAQQAGINASRDLGIQGVNEQSIATPFLVGQSAAITNRAATQLGALSAQAVPLQQRLTIEQAKRQSAITISKEALDYQKTAFNQSLANKKFEEDKRQYGLNYALKQKELAIKQQQSGGLLNTSNNITNQPYVDAFNSAVIGLPALQMKQAQNTFQQYLNKGDTEGAKNYIIRVAMAGASTDQQNQAIGRKSGLDSLATIKQLLTKVPTDILTGTLENTIQKLGVSSNPDLAYIGSQIQQQIQIYRRSMTGVAFSPQESAEYAKIFPDITNLASLNNAKIDSLIESFNRNNRAVLSFYIGDSNYDKLFGKYETPPLPSGRISEDQLKKDYESYLKQQGTKNSTSVYDLNQNQKGFFDNFLSVFGL